MMVLAAAFVMFVVLSLMSLGGGGAVLPEMERLCVSAGWVSPEEFATSYSMGQLAPGPNCMMVAVLGYKLAGIPGALLIAVAFLAPSTLLAWWVGKQYSRFRGTHLQVQLRAALAPITVGLVAASFDLLARQNLATPGAALLAALVAFCLLRYRLSPALVMIAALAIGPAFV